MSDPIGALVALASADAPIAALASAGIFGAELPEAVAAQMPIGALVIQATGGLPLTSGTFAQHDAQRFDVTSYGKTVREAAVLADKVSRLFRGISRRKVGTTLIHWIDSAGGFSTGRDRDGRWPQVFQSFQLFHALEEV